MLGLWSGTCICKNQLAGFEVVTQVCILKYAKCERKNHVTHMYFSTENINALYDSIQTWSAYYIYVCEIFLVFYW